MSTAGRVFGVSFTCGLVLHNGEMAEIKTGKRKTLVAILPAYLNALTGKGVRIVSVNDYLAQQDCEWVGRVPRFLGLKVGLIRQNMTREQRKENYLCDITYVANSELSFDSLRDNLATSVEELVLRDFNYCIIDEVYSILVDEDYKRILLLLMQLCLLYQAEVGRNEIVRKQREKSDKT